MSNELWKGRFNKQLNDLANQFNASIKIDSRMIREDILGSIAHATMLGKQNIISLSESNKLVEGLTELLEQIESGAVTVDLSQEDVHTFVEKTLTDRLGETGKRLHTARSRNDQVATDIRLYLLKRIKSLQKATFELIDSIITLAEKHTATVMAGYTHLQRAQPVTFAHHLLAYCNMLIRDNERLKDCIKRTSSSPLGSCALAGTTYPIDRKLTAQLLGFDEVAQNSMDAVSDRDFVIELLSDISIIMMHLSRFSEEVILWSSWEFKYIELSDEYSTGSSIMPQKKNPDIAELIRGKTGRTYGNLVAMLTIMKGLPLAYNKDMQEDKEGIFDSLDTAESCLKLFGGMINTLSVNTKNMLSAAEKGYINATDCADYLTKKGMPFRDAYKLTGELVAYCIKQGISLNALSLEQYKEFNTLFESDIYEQIDLYNCMAKRTSFGAPNPECVIAQITAVKQYLGQNIGDL